MSDRLSKGDLVLITGAAGLIGSAIAEELIKRGFTVRGVTRHAEKETLLKDKFDRLYGPDAFEWFEIPDATKPGAYREALQGVGGFIHTATDASFSSNYDQVVNGTIDMTLGIFKSALEVSSVKSAVITSSRVSVYSPQYGQDVTVSLDDWNDQAVEFGKKLPDDNPIKPVVVYAASKTRAEQEVWKFVKEQKPSFAVAAVLPEMVIGPADVNPAKRVYSTSSWLTEIFQGKTDGFGVAFLHPPGRVVDVRDTAILHVAALLAPDAANARIWASAHSITLNEILKIWRKAYPDRQLPPDFDLPTASKITIDDSHSVDLLQRYAGRSWLPIEQSILENVKAFA